MRKLLMVKRKNRVFCIILSIVLFAAGVITVQQKKSQPE